MVKKFNGNRLTIDHELAGNTLVICAADRHSAQVWEVEGKIRHPATHWLE